MMINFKAIIDVGGGGGGGSSSNSNRSTCSANNSRTYSSCAIVIFLIECSILQIVVSEINHSEFLAQMKVPQCRQDCLDKFDADDLACLQKLDCSICDFPPYQFHNFPDAINLMCWNSCAPRSTSHSKSASTVVQHSNGVIDSLSSASSSSSSVLTSTADASDTIQLSINSMIRDGSLTMADIVWYADSIEPHQCLVTWEVFGGGIKGNLLTDTHEAQLSLWPDSKYHIQVTCKNKNTNKMSKSLPILIDTTNALSKTSTTTLRATIASTSSKLKLEPVASMPSHVLVVEEPPPQHSNQKQQQQHSTAQTEKSDNNNRRRQHDETEEGIAGIIQKQQHHNHQATAKPYHKSVQDDERDNDIRDVLRRGDDNNVVDDKDGVVKSVAATHNNGGGGGGGDGNENSINQKSTFSTPANDAPPEATLAHYQTKSLSSSSRDAMAAAAKLSKSSSQPSWKIKHIQIETTLTVFFGVFIVVIALVICTIFSIKHSRKSNEHCDKTILISGSNSSCSSSECEMDFNASTMSNSNSSIVSLTTAMHV